MGKNDINWYYKQETDHFYVSCMSWHLEIHMALSEKHDNWHTELKAWFTIFPLHIIIYTNMYIRNIFLINVDCKSQITYILLRLNLIACVIDFIFISISPTEKGKM